MDADIALSPDAISIISSRMVETDALAAASAMEMRLARILARLGLLSCLAATPLRRGGHDRRRNLRATDRRASQRRGDADSIDSLR